jgi:hypothetical protein
MDDLKFMPKAVTPVVAWSQRNQSIIVNLGFWARLPMVLRLLFRGHARLPRADASDTCH